MDTVDAAKRSQDKDVEIERLEAEVKHKTTFVELLQDQVRVLKEKNKGITFQYLEARSLVTELCDALAHYAWANHEDMKLIQSAREATR